MTKTKINIVCTECKKKHKTLSSLDKAYDYLGEDDGGCNICNDEHAYLELTFESYEFCMLGPQPSIMGSNNPVVYICPAGFSEYDQNLYDARIEEAGFSEAMECHFQHKDDNLDTENCRQILNDLSFMTENKKLLKEFV